MKTNVIQLAVIHAMEIDAALMHLHNSIDAHVLRPSLCVAPAPATTFHSFHTRFINK